MLPFHLATGIFVKYYLIAYNCLAFGIWCYAFLITAASISNLASVEGRLMWFSQVGPVVKVAMSLAVLEIIHAATRVVKSNPQTTMIQVLSRLHVIYLLWDLAPVTREGFGTLMVIVAWTLAELVRYPFYIGQLVWPGKDLAILTWLRYSGFLILYPMGILGELMTMWAGARAFSETEEYRHWPVAMPNKMNFEVNLAVAYWMTILSYLPGSVHMYTHMMKQRVKGLDRTTKEKTK